MLFLLVEINWKLPATLKRAINWSLFWNINDPILSAKSLEWGYLFKMRVFFLKVILKEGLEISIYTIMTLNKLSKYVLLNPIKRFGCSNIFSFQENVVSTLLQSVRLSNIDCYKKFGFYCAAGILVLIKLMWMSFLKWVFSEFE